MKIDKHKIWLMIGLLMFVIVIGFTVYTLRGSLNSAGKATSTVCDSYPTFGNFSYQIIPYLNNINTYDFRTENSCFKRMGDSFGNDNIQTLFLDSTSPYACVKLYRGIPIIKVYNKVLSSLTDRSDLYQLLSYISFNKNLNIDLASSWNLCPTNMALPSYYNAGSNMYASGFKSLKDIENCIDEAYTKNTFMGSSVGSNQFSLQSDLTCPYLCVPDCSGKVCGQTDGCGGSCGLGLTSQECTTKFGFCTITGTQSCNALGQWDSCQGTDPRISTCSGKDCGYDNCGGSCQNKCLSSAAPLCISDNSCGIKEDACAWIYRGLGEFPASIPTNGQYVSISSTEYANKNACFKRMFNYFGSAVKTTSTSMTYSCVEVYHGVPLVKGVNANGQAVYQLSYLSPIGNVGYGISGPYGQFCPGNMTKPTFIRGTVSSNNYVDYLSGFDNIDDLKACIEEGAVSYSAFQQDYSFSLILPLEQGLDCKQCGSNSHFDESGACVCDEGVVNTNGDLVGGCEGTPSCSVVEATCGHIGISCPSNVVVERLSCPTGQVCQNDQCVCVPNCTGKMCGSDSCGGQCLDKCATNLGANWYCSDQSTGSCAYNHTNACLGKVCGPDGNGGSCGTCGTGKICNANGVCQNKIIISATCGSLSGSFYEAYPQGLQGVGSKSFFSLDSDKDSNACFKRMKNVFGNFGNIYNSLSGSYACDSIYKGIPLVSVTLSDSTLNYQMLYFSQSTSTILPGNLYLVCPSKSLTGDATNSLDSLKGCIDEGVTSGYFTTSAEVYPVDEGLNCVNECGTFQPACDGTYALEKNSCNNERNRHNCASVEGYTCQAGQCVNTLPVCPNECTQMSQRSCVWGIPAICTEIGGNSTCKGLHYVWQLNPACAINQVCQGGSCIDLMNQCPTEGDSCESSGNSILSVSCHDTNGDNFLEKSTVACRIGADWNENPEVCSLGKCVTCTDQDGDKYCKESKADLIFGTDRLGWNDCNDQDKGLNPLTPEICNNNVDDNCNGDLDCADAGCAGKSCGDGNKVCVSGSCIIPPEICTNGKDDDGDGLVDCADSDCNGQVGGPNGELCEFGKELTCNDGFNNDGDGNVFISGSSWADCKDIDCTGTSCFNEVSCGWTPSTSSNMVYYNYATSEDQKVYQWLFDNACMQRMASFGMDLNFEQQQQVQADKFTSARCLGVYKGVPLINISSSLGTTMGWVESDPQPLNSVVPLTTTNACPIEKAAHASVWFNSGMEYYTRDLEAMKRCIDEGESLFNMFEGSCFLLCDGSNGGLDKCGSTCVSFSDDPKNCGECGNTCPNNVNCVNSKCFKDADGDGVNELPSLDGLHDQCPNTPKGYNVDLVGCMFGDFNRDGKVDQGDFTFRECVTYNSETTCQTKYDSAIVTEVKEKMTQGIFVLNQYLWQIKSNYDLSLNEGVK